MDLFSSMKVELIAKKLNEFLSNRCIVRYGMSWVSLLHGTHGKW
jgi:hypothetical protein